MNGEQGWRCHRLCHSIWQLQQTLCAYYTTPVGLQNEVGYLIADRLVRLANLSVQWAVEIYWDEFEDGFDEIRRQHQLPPWHYYQ